MPNVKRPRNADPTAIGFFKWADQDTLYETCERACECELGREIRLLAYKNAFRMLDGEIFVSKSQKRATNGVEVCDMCSYRVRNCRERSSELNITTIHEKDMKTRNQENQKRTHVAPSGRMTESSSSFTTAPPMGVQIGISTVYLPVFLS